MNTLESKDEGLRKAVRLFLEEGSNMMMHACKGRFAQKEFVAPVTSLLEKKAERVLRSTQQHLVKALRDEKLKIKLNNKIKKPEEFESKERLLI